MYHSNLIFHRSADSVFMMKEKKIKIVFVREHIKPGGKALRLPVRSLVNGLNYHMAMAMVKDGSFIRCCNNGLLMV